VVKGVRYLHSCGIAHGDIKAPNVLISDSTPPRALLADFGFNRVATLSVRMSSGEQGTASFMAPELLFSAKFGLEKGVPSKEADIYALGMTVYQVLTGEWPFYPRKETEVVHAVISGERPPKPENAEEIGMTDVLWDLLRECWRGERTTRPNISDMLRRFCDITGERRTTISAAGLHLDTINIRDSVHSESTFVDSPSCLDIDGQSVTTMTEPWCDLGEKGTPESGDKLHDAEPVTPISVTKQHCFPPWNHVKRFVRSINR